MGGGWSLSSLNSTIKVFSNQRCKTEFQSNGSLTSFKKGASGFNQTWKDLFGGLGSEYYLVNDDGVLGYKYGHSRKNWQFFGHEKILLTSLGFEPGTSRLLSYVVN